MRREFRGGSAVVRAAKLLIDAIQGAATSEPVQNIVNFGYQVTDPAERVLIFRGAMYNIGGTVGLPPFSVGYSSRILYAMRAMTMLRRGGKDMLSIILVHYSPTEEQISDFMEESGSLGRKIAPSKTDTIVKEIQELRDRVRILEEQVQTLLDHRLVGDVNSNDRHIIR